MLHNQKQSILCLDDLVKLDDGRMAHYPENVDLPGHALNVVDIVYLPLVEDLDGHLLPSEYVVALLHFAECALPERLLDLVVAYQAVAHVYYFLVLLALYWYTDLCLVHTVFKLYEPI